MSSCGFYFNIFTFTANNSEPQSEYILLQSMLKVYYFFKTQIQFDDEELSELRIMCTCCKKSSHCRISKVKQ